MKKISFTISLRLKLRVHLLIPRWKMMKKKFNMHFHSLYSHKNQNKIQIGIFFKYWSISNQKIPWFTSSIYCLNYLCFFLYLLFFVVVVFFLFWIVLLFFVEQCALLMQEYVFLLPCFLPYFKRRFYGDVNYLFSFFCRFNSCISNAIIFDSALMSLFFCRCQRLKVCQVLLVQSQICDLKDKKFRLFSPCRSFP